MFLHVACLFLWLPLFVCEEEKLKANAINNKNMLERVN